MNEKKLIIFTGPSGVGKSTVEKYFINDESLNIHFSVSATTRKKRKDEVNGKSYYFISRDEFLMRVRDGEFLEWAEYAGNLYGTLLSEVSENIKIGKNVFLEIEIVGAKNVISIFKDATTIFLLPPSFEELSKRLHNRKTDSSEVIKERLLIAENEVNSASLFKYNIVNNIPEETANKIKKIIKSI